MTWLYVSLVIGTISVNIKPYFVRIIPLSSNSIIWFLGATGIPVGIVIICYAILPSPCSLFPDPLFPLLYS